MAKCESFYLALLSQECFILFACGNSGLIIRYECWDQLSNFWGGKGIWVLKGLALESVDHLQVYCHLPLLSLSAWTQGSLLLGLLSSLLTMVYNYSVANLQVLLLHLFQFYYFQYGSKWNLFFKFNFCIVVLFFLSWQNVCKPELHDSQIAQFPRRATRWLTCTRRKQAVTSELSPPGKASSPVAFPRVALVNSRLIKTSQNSDPESTEKNG